MSRFRIWHCSYYITRLGCYYWRLPFWATRARFLCLFWSSLPWSSTVGRGEQLVCSCCAGPPLPLHHSLGAEMCGRESCKGTTCPDQSQLLGVFSDHHQQKCKWEPPLGFPYSSGYAAEAKLAESRGHPKIHPMHFLLPARFLFQQKLFNH